MKKVFLPTGLLLSALLGGCSTPSPSYVVLLPDADGTVGKVVVQGKAGQQMVSTAQHGALLDGSQPPAPVSNEVLQRDFGAVMKARPTLPEVFILYFQSQGSSLTAQSQALLPQVVQQIAGRSAVDVSVVGHSDAQGSDEVNDKLSLARAQFVVQQLQAMGIRKNIPLTVESYGKRMPRVPTPDGVAEPLNRRVEVTVR